MSADLARVLDWWRSGAPVAVATVVATSGSAPRLPGSWMAVGPGGAVVGSVSGGCVEGDVYEVAREVVETGTPTLRRYDVTDDDALGVGLTCGGRIELFVERLDRAGFPELDAIADDLQAGRPVAVATLIEHPTAPPGSRLVLRPGDADRLRGEHRTAPVLGGRRLDEAVRDDAAGMLAQGASGVLAYGPDGERRGEGTRVFVRSLASRPRLLVFGATDFAASLATVAGFLGYRVTVCDARPVFATPERFPTADEVVVDWPHRYLAKEAERGEIDARTALCVLTHDPRFDVPLLRVALDLPQPAYIGAMGSRRTHEDRVRRLLEAGATAGQLARLRSPIGLDLGARTPEETALSIAAEMVAARWGGSGASLSGTGGPIHHAAAG
ncbi:XdhC family protein [Nocardioides sp. BP30]|uniref:XdhC family protein n=1 Tax=Nocardioides sp. BP30 TaxID=3036374 RepID=UPI0024688FC2|nr:XdhC family protein [Nocardioides sp. BP30]WGL52633.1 XdhC family protein [Nocardioides sp. BP30]